MRACKLGRGGGGGGVSRQMTKIFCLSNQGQIVKKF